MMDLVLKIIYLGIIPCRDLRGSRASASESVDGQVQGVRVVEADSTGLEGRDYGFDEESDVCQ